MDDPSLWRLYTSFRGRIGRRQYWIGIFYLLLTSLIVTILAALFLASTSDFSEGGLSILKFTVCSILLYPSAAVLAKRIHDHDWPGYVAAFLLIPVAIDTVASAMLANDVNPFGVATSYVGGSIHIIGGIVALWFIVQFGFMRGTIGKNRYGPDPLTLGD
jgi:uncharacterized membrane protein YhaH (DUF805 family)